MVPSRYRYHRRTPFVQNRHLCHVHHRFLLLCFRGMISSPKDILDIPSLEGDPRGAASSLCLPSGKYYPAVARDKDKRASKAKLLISRYRKEVSGVWALNPSMMSTHVMKDQSWTRIP